jgi:hypothetical protein
MKVKDLLDRCCKNIILGFKQKEFTTNDVVFKITQQSDLQKEYIKLSEQYGSYNKLNAQIGRYLGNQQEKLGICKNGGKESSITNTGRQSKNQKWKILSLVIPFLLLLMSMSAFSQESLPKGAKLQTIDYSKRDGYGVCHGKCYKIESYVIKGEFVENQTITFSSKSSKISGTLTVKNGNAYIDGTYQVEGGSIQGLFICSNNENGIGLTPNKKNAVEFSITLENFTHCIVGNNTIYKSKYDFSEKEWEQIIRNTKIPTDLSKQIEDLYEKKQNKIREEERDRKLREEEKQRKLQEEEKQRKLQEEKKKEEMLIEEVEAVLDNDFYSPDCPPVEVLEKLRTQLEQQREQIKKLQGTPEFFKVMDKATYLAKLQTGLSNAIRTQIMTKKHGVATAKKIMSGNFEIGMPKAIVEEIIGAKIFYYKKSTSTMAGKKSEIWEFDYNADALRIFDLKTKNNLKSECPTFVFRDEKVTDIIW